MDEKKCQERLKALCGVCKEVMNEKQSYHEGYLKGQEDKEKEIREKIIK